MKRMKMAHEEGFEALRGEEFEKEHAAEGKGHEEAVDPLGGDPAGISPIALGLLRWKDLDGKKSSGGRLHRSQVIPEDTDAARISHGFDLLVDAHPTETRIGFKEGMDFIFERIELGGPIGGRRSRENLLL
jgi:murein DD-endopeptidase MepM/ murein hydrolase activator NlpD